MASGEFVVIYFTCRSDKHAELISEECVNRDLVACANIRGAISSIYKWNGELRREKEVSVILKTKDDKVKDIESVIKSMHDYDNPCILVLPVKGGSSEYLKWVEDCLG